MRVFIAAAVAGEFAISSFTQTSSTARAIETALGTLSTLKQQGVGDEAIASVRSYILGQYPLGFETGADWAAALADLDLYQLPDSHIDDFGRELERVDAASVRQVVDNAYPEPSDVDIVLIGDAARMRDQAGQFGPVAEKPLEAPDFNPPPRSAWAALKGVWR